MGKVIKVSDEVYKELLRIKAKLTAEEGRIVTFDDAIRFLLRKAKEMGESEEALVASP